jgi:uncharacterized repeat protein (TIGR01451 family)
MLVSSFGLAGAVQAAQYTWQSLPPPPELPPSLFTTPYALNNVGQVFGRDVENGPGRWPVLWTNAVGVTLPIPAGYGWVDTGGGLLNDAGVAVSVVHSNSASANGGIRPIVWQGGAATVVPNPMSDTACFARYGADPNLPGADQYLNVYPAGLNNAGHILLFACNSLWIVDSTGAVLVAGPPPLFDPSVGLYPPYFMTYLYAPNHLNDADVASAETGLYGGSLQASHPGVLSGLSSFSAAPLTYGNALGINNRNQALAWVLDQATNIASCYLWDGATLATLPGCGTSPNNLGQVAYTSSGQLRLLYQDGVVSSITLPPELSGFGLSTGSGLNDVGQLIGMAGSGVLLTPLTADLSITKTASPNPVTVGASLTYTLTIANHGPSDATGVVVTDTLPASESFVSTTPSQGTCTGTSSISCNLGSLANGASATVSIVVTPTQAGAISNTASVSGDQYDSDRDNNSDTQTTTVTAADLSIVKTASPSPATVGSPLTYTLSVTNNGPSDATGVVVNDSLLAGLSFVSSSASQGTCSGTSTVSCNLGALANGASATVTIVVTPTQVGGVSNTATVTANESDPAAGNNSATIVTTILPSSGAPQFTSANATTFVVKTPNTFTVTATGTPPPTLSHTGTLPSGVTFTAATGALAGTPAAGTVGKHTITFTAKNGVLPNATQTFTLTIIKADQTIAFGALPDVGFGIPNFTLAATASSGLTVKLTSLTPAVCTVTTATVKLVAAGTCTIAANQAGNANYNPAPQVTQSFVVALTATTVTTITASFEPSVIGQSYAVSVTVTSSTGVPKGTVTIDDGHGGTCTDSTISSLGVASCSIASHTTGSLTLTAAYSGSSGYGPSSGSTTHVVNQALTKATISTSGSPALIGTQVTITSKVTAVLPGKGIPTGTVQFTTNGTLLATASLDSSGNASFSTTALPVGVTSIVANYLGDANYAPSSSGTLNQSVAALPVLQFSVASVTIDETVGTVTLTVTHAGSALGAASVAYASSDGTATAPDDYGAVSGVLAWAKGDTASKTIVVPIVADGISEPAEKFTVTLSSPTGATLGARTTITVNIRAN